ncbi:MAG: rseP [Verrucomicrobia bacterium]|nr:rseP [Verrucomicrobiota bacterium]
MLPDLLTSIFTNAWTFFLAVLLLGLSIFVHELGHFLAARRRGVKVERFSIGFGPAIWSRRGKDGVEYRLAWFPLGGYVLLPQLADLGAIEGRSELDASDLPPISYPTKMFVFVAGALFNTLFAFVLACALTFLGLPESSSFSTTRIGYVTEKIELADGTKVPSPALLAGLKIGDIVRAIDGHPVKNWNEVRFSLALGDGHTSNGKRSVALTVERDGKMHDFTLEPQIAGDEKERKIGIAPGFELLVLQVAPGSVAERAGFQKGDELLRMNDTLTLLPDVVQEQLETNRAHPIAAQVRRAGAVVALSIPALPEAKPTDDFGLTFTTGVRLTHPSPFTLLGDQVKMTFRSLWSLISPHSDMGLSKASGVVGILRIFQSAAESGIRAALLITILVNVNLAIFNLLPIPVLDGGQMLFATVGRLRGRALPVNFIVTAQSVCFVLLLSLIVYVGFFDFRRWARDYQADRAEASRAEAARPAAPAKP